MKERVGIHCFLRSRVFVIYLLFLTVFIFGKSGEVKAKEVKVTTENGAVLLFERSDGICTFSGIGKQKAEIIIPETVKNGTPVISLNFNLEKEYKKVTHIHIPSTATKIEDFEDEGSGNIFKAFPNLERITVGEKNTYFVSGDEKLLLDANGKLWAVAPGAKGKVTIPATVTEMEKTALSNLTAVSEFEVQAGNVEYQSVNGVLYSKDGKTLLRYPVKKAGKDFSIPKGVKTVGKSAFADVKILEKVIMPNSTRKIDRKAFYHASVTNVKLNKNLRVLEELAFYKSKLKSIKFPEGLREAEIGSIPVHKLVLPKNLGDVTAEMDYNYAGIIADVIVVKNPALNLEDLEVWDCQDSNLTKKVIYAYKGSAAYMNFKDRNDVRLKRLKGKTFKPVPKATGKVDTSWYSKKKKHFTLKTPAQLAGLSKLSEKTGFAGKTIKLGKNLNMKGYKNFTPIQSFEGCFDGNGKTIKNLRINQREEMVGLFSYVEDMKGVKVKNLKVQGKVTGGNYTGGIVGYNYRGKRIENCSFSGQVKGYGYYGKVYGNNQQDKEYED